MALVYRAMWSDDLVDPVEEAFRGFCEWVSEKGCRFTVPSTGTVSGPIGRGLTDEDAPARGVEAEVRVERAGPDTSRGIESVRRCVLVETRDDRSRWTTTLRAWSGPACRTREDPGLARFWVDVEIETHDPRHDVSIRAPRLVRNLLQRGLRPQRRGLRLGEGVHRYGPPSGAETLAEMITSLDRDLPLIVFTPLVLPTAEQEGLHPSDVEHAMRQTAVGLAGTASVCCIDDGPMIDELREILGTPYAVWGGAARIYMPGADPAVDDGWLHRYFPPERYLRTRGSVTNLFSRYVLPIALSRRAGPSYDAAREVLRRETLLRQHGEYVELVEAENRKLNDDVDASNSLLGELQLKYENLLDDHEALQGDLADLQQRLDRARTALRELGFNGVDAPARANHPSEAVDLAREYLGDHLVIHPDACVDLDLLDSAREARAWGQTTWEAFRALHAYGSALAGPNRYSGDFWTWCEQSGDPRVWRATTKKLAMTESDTVRSNARLRAQRMLPVDRAVAPSGETEMLAHMKIAEGGGNLAPRVYFHVEEGAARVHVGYVGPHKNMRNKHS